MKFRKTIVISLLGIICSLLTSCGYRFRQDVGANSSYTVSVPYVDGDRSGDLTAAIIHSFATSGFFDYVNEGGNVTLKVKVIELRDENIGFRYDHNQDGQLNQTLIPAETRLCGLIEVVLIETATGCVLAGPARISANAEFDHEYYFSRDGVNFFSLGQVTDFDTARDAAFHPLNRALAQKVVDFVSNSW